MNKDDSQKKNILIFSTAYLPFVGGAEIAVKEITDRIQEFEFDMLTARLDSKLSSFEKIGNVNIYRLGFGRQADKYIFPCTAFFKTRSLSKSRKYVLIWSIMASYAGFAALFFKLARPKTPFLLTLQEGDPPEEIEKKVRFVMPVFKKIFLKADYIQTISNFLADWARKIGYKGVLKVIPNGVNVVNFRSSAVDLRIVRENLKSKLGIKDEEKVIVTVSRLVKKNGVEDLITAMKELKSIEPQLKIKLLIIGKGKQEEYLKDLAKELGLENNVLFLGEIGHHDLPQYLWISDVFVRPSLSEGLGNAFLEAMAAGVPVIGTKVGGIPDFLVDPSTSSGQTPTGLFCEVQNPKSVAEKISILLKDENLRLRLIENGEKLVEEKYDWNKIAEEMKNIFLNLEKQQ